MLATALKRAAAAAAALSILAPTGAARPFETDRGFSLAIVLPGTRPPSHPAPRLDRRPDAPEAPTRAKTPAGLIAAAGAPENDPESMGTGRRWGRSQLEFWVFMSASTANYWLKYAQFSEDWQFGLNWADQSRRFFTLKAWRFDSNAFRLNWTHALAGGIYYQFGRSNGFSWPESFLFSLGGSLLWEYVAEWREVISITDMFFTSFGGYAVGEPWIRMAERLAARPGLAPRILSFVNPAFKLNRWLDGDAAPALDRSGEFEFRVDLGLQSLADEAGGHRGHLAGGVRARSVDLPEAVGSGPESGVLKDTFFSELFYSAAVRDGRWQELEFSTRVSGWGWHRRSRGGNGRTSSFFLGLGSAFTYFQKRPVVLYDTPAVKVRKGPPLDLSEPRRFRDKLSVVHLAGPLAGWTVGGPDWRVRLVADAYVDYAMVNALPLNVYSAENDISGLKTTVLYYGYYSGFGTAFSAEADLQWKGWRLEGRGRRGAYGSIEGLDRFQEDIRDDVHLSDTWTTWDLRLGWRPPGFPLEWTAGWDAILRWGRIGSFTDRRSESRFRFGVGFYL